MHINEIDWRIEPLHDVIVGIEAGLKSVEERLKQEEDFDGLSAREHAEMLLGLGFVAAQAYVLGVWTDLNRIRKKEGLPPVGKIDCYASDPVTLHRGPTRIQVINATANYFKHHDEWLAWPNNETTQALRRVGITENTEFPCVEATQLFCGRSWEFIVLHQIVREWRAHVFNIFR